MTDEQLRHLISLSNAATPGPWEHFTEQGIPEVPNDPADSGQWETISRKGRRNVILASELEVADGEFIVAARQLVSAGDGVVIRR